MPASGKIRILASVVFGATLCGEGGAKAQNFSGSEAYLGLLFVFVAVPLVGGLVYLGPASLAVFLFDQTGGRNWVLRAALWIIITVPWIWIVNATGIDVVKLTGSLFGYR